MTRPGADLGRGASPVTGSSRSRPRAPEEPLRRIDVGAVAVYPLVQFHYRVDPMRFFPDLPTRSIDRSTWYWQPPYLDDGLLVVDMGAFLVRTPDRTILLDLSVGDGKPRPNPHFHHRSDDLPALLHRTGTRMSDVDTVVFTHLHVDHVGYATHWDGTTWSPTFPGVPHLVTAAEYDFWTSAAAGPHLARLGDYISDSIAPLAATGVLRLAEPDTEICPEVRLRPAPGHTPGNVCVEIVSQGRRAVFAGDMVHHAVQLAFPDWSTDFCVDRARAAQARQALLADLADSDALLFPAHFPDSIPGRVVSATRGGYTFQPYPGAVVDPR